jgi:methionyl-tRNA synthetase
MDSSFTWDGMVAKVNNELANNIGNLVSRCLKFIEKNYQSELSAKYFSDFVSSAQAQKCSADLKEHQKILDAVQIRKSIEHLMKIGFDANTYFTERAPWAQFKTDVHAAAQTLAFASSYILILGVAFAPYLPGMSEKLLSHFPALTADQKRGIYGGDISILNDYFKNGLKLQKPVEMLVPKLDEKKLTELQKALEAK